MKYEVGQRGVDNYNVVCYVAHASKVKGVPYELWSYWVVDDEGGIPGNGKIRVPLTFIAFDEPPRKMPHDFSDQLQEVMPGFEHFNPEPKKRRSR